jgi:hypothetical protein
MGRDTADTATLTHRPLHLLHLLRCDALLDPMRTDVTVRRDQQRDPEQNLRDVCARRMSQHPRQIRHHVLGGHD